MDIIVGTSNAGKLREYQVLLAELPINFISLRDAGLENLEVDEPFETYAENAIHKAKIYAQAANIPVLADDSGLEVDALDGRPGVYSARYAEGSDSDRYTKLLGELQGVPTERRTARFICVTALAFPDERESIATTGTCEGRIAHQPTTGGVVGFGYDFVFVPNGYDIALSALPMAAKNALSHRGNALKGMLPLLREVLRES